jgi:murein DD-endopeptidase MepM/ murein hydrolase activator NlpD
MKFIWGDWVSRYRKGSVELAAIVIVMAFIIVGIHILVKMQVVTEVIKVRGEVDVYLTLDDKGTESLSFLSSRTGENDYMEILGSLTAKDAEKTIQTDLNRIENTLHKLENYYIIVRDSSGEIIYEKKKGDLSQAVKAYELVGINLDWPVRERPVVISSGFGYRELNNVPDFHGGIDIAFPEGTEVYPAAEGKIVRIGRGCEAAKGACKTLDPDATDPSKKYNYPECGCGYGLGNYVVIKHHQEGKTFYTFYVHLQSVPANWEEDDKVDPQDLIGFVGNTGYSMGAHLHFEIGSSEKKSDTTAIDPCPYLPDAPVECEQPSHRVRGYEVDIPLPGGKKGKIEMVIW